MPPFDINDGSDPRVQRMMAAWGAFGAALRKGLPRSPTPLRPRRVEVQGRVYYLRPFLG